MLSRNIFANVSVRCRPTLQCTFVVFGHFWFVSYSVGVFRTLPYNNNNNNNNNEFFYRAMLLQSAVRTCYGSIAHLSVRLSVCQLYNTVLLCAILAGHISKLIPAWYIYTHTHTHTLSLDIPPLVGTVSTIAVVSATAWGRNSESCLPVLELFCFSFILMRGHCFSMMSWMWDGPSILCLSPLRSWVLHTLL